LRPPPLFSFHFGFSSFSSSSRVGSRGTDVDHLLSFFLPRHQRGKTRSLLFFPFFSFTTFPLLPRNTAHNPEVCDSLFFRCGGNRFMMGSSFLSSVRLFLLLFVFPGFFFFFLLYFVFQHFFLCLPVTGPTTTRKIITPPLFFFSCASFLSLSFQARRGFP